jgi:hypothetical protein
VLEETGLLYTRLGIRSITLSSADEVALHAQGMAVALVDAQDPKGATPTAPATPVGSPTVKNAEESSSN